MLDARVQGDEEPDRLPRLHVLVPPGLHDPFGEGLRLDLELRQHARADACLLSLAAFLVGDQALLRHQPQNEKRPLTRPVPGLLPKRVQAGRGLDHAGQQSGLVER